MHTFVIEVCVKTENKNDMFLLNSFSEIRYGINKFLIIKLEAWAQLDLKNVY